MKSSWQQESLGRLLQQRSRPVDVQPDKQYREIGIRSHGRGVFHKEPVLGFDLGNKKVFWIEPGDFVLNIVFAWEGAVALLGDSEAGMIASHRFPTFRVEESRLNSRFLLLYLRTQDGRDFLQKISPGGAGRNRTLSKRAFLAHTIPLPGISEQLHIVQSLDALQTEISEWKRLQAETAAELDALQPALLDRAFKGEL